MPKAIIFQGKPLTHHPHYIAYRDQMGLAKKKRNIEWQFTFEEWLDWWGDDIHNRGILKGQLVMARYGDIGPYHPDNVRKTTVEDNVKEARANRNPMVKQQLTCPHCGTTSNSGNINRWHMDNCKHA